MRYPKDFPGIFPRSRAPLAEHLVVYDCSREPAERAMALAALQGIVNRSAPRLYMINSTNPPDDDEFYLRYMQDKGYAGTERRIGSAEELVELFREEITGAIVYDPELPGSVHAACMLAGITRALPLSPPLAEEFGLPVVADLRGRWRRNVEAYRFIFENYWDQMNHYVLAWHHPLTNAQYLRDYLVEFNIFTFWLSGYADNLKGADPPAEEEFIHELFAATPANIPVMGWASYGHDSGISEYEALRWCSEYGKFLPGTEFCSNLSIHTAIHPPDTVFVQNWAGTGRRLQLEGDKVYVSVNILDSGDSLWYWQLAQRHVWADAERGTVPIGWSMNVTLYDTLPLAAQWYFENATPNDRFFAAVSGLGYMHTGAYASRFQPLERERIWREYVRLTDEYCRRLDVHGIELYNGSWGETTPPAPETFLWFVEGMPGLDYILADVGRHDSVNAGNANYALDNTVVFHTLSRYRPWASGAELSERDRNEEIQWLVDDITANSPADRPGFMSVMALSWTFFPSWISELCARLPGDYIVVLPEEMADLYRQYLGGGW